MEATCVSFLCNKSQYALSVSLWFGLFFLKTVTCMISENFRIGCTLKPPELPHLPMLFSLQIAFENHSQKFAEQKIITTSL